MTREERLKAIVKRRMASFSLDEFIPDFEKEHARQLLSARLMDLSSQPAAEDEEVSRTVLVDGTGAIVDMSSPEVWLKLAVRHYTHAILHEAEDELDALEEQEAIDKMDAGFGDIHEWEKTLSVPKAQRITSQVPELETAEERAEAWRQLSARLKAEGVIRPAENESAAVVPEPTKPRVRGLNFRACRNAAALLFFLLFIGKAIYLNDSSKDNSDLLSNKPDANRVLQFPSSADPIISGQNTKNNGSNTVVEGTPAMRPESLVFRLETVPPDEEIVSRPQPLAHRKQPAIPGPAPTAVPETPMPPPIVAAAAAPEAKLPATRPRHALSAVEYSSTLLTEGNTRPKKSTPFLPVVMRSILHGDNIP